MRCASSDALGAFLVGCAIRAAKFVSFSRRFEEVCGLLSHDWTFQATHEKRGNKPGNNNSSMLCFLRLFCSTLFLVSP